MNRGPRSQRKTPQGSTSYGWTRDRVPGRSPAVRPVGRTHRIESNGEGPRPRTKGESGIGGRFEASFGAKEKAPPRARRRRGMDWFDALPRRSLLYLRRDLVWDSENRGRVCTLLARCIARKVRSTEGGQHPPHPSTALRRLCAVLLSSRSLGRDLLLPQSGRESALSTSAIARVVRSPLPVVVLAEPARPN